MAVKPANLIYGVDDKPPFKVSAILGLQHAFTMSSCLVFPVVVGREIGASFGEIQALVCFSMIAAGIGTILQAIHKGPCGSGYLCPNLVAPSFLSFSIQAAWIGGLPLMFGMTFLSGVFEMIFATVANKLKKLFPAEITGLVVLMIAVSLVPLAASKFVGIDYEGDSINSHELVIAAITLLSMIGFNIWGKGKLKLYCVIMGLGIGYFLSFTTGIISKNELHVLMNTAWLSIPREVVHIFNLKFDWGLIFPVLIITLCQSVKTIGNIITCQKINDASWSAPDMKNIGKGLIADGLTTSLSGAVGGIATDTSASNVGLSVATSATSRRIAYFAGAIFAFMAFSPKITAIFSIMPRPIMGAILIFAISFMVISGIEILLSSKMDSRKTFVIGISITFGLSAIILPDLYSRVPDWLNPIFSSSLTLSTILAIILNQVFSIGHKKKALPEEPIQVSE